MDNFNKKIIKGFAWESSTRLVVQIASWSSTIWVARILTPDDYGLIGISGIFTGLFITLSGMGLSQALINKKELYDYDKANVFWTSFVTAFLFYFILFISSPYIASYYASEELENIIRIAGLIVIASPLSVVPRALVARKLRFKAIALISMVSNVMVIASTLYMVYLGWGYWALVLSTVGAEMFLLVAYMVVAGYIPGRPKNIKTVLPLYAFGFSVMAARLASYLNMNWPTIILGSTMGKTSVGHFEMARILARMPMQKVGEIFSQIAFPAFSHIKEDRVKVKRLFLSMNRFLFMIIAPMFLGIALTAAEFIPLILGEKWLIIVFPMQIICLVNIVIGGVILIPTLLEGMGRPKASLKYQLIMAASSPVAMLVGVQWGLNGMLIGWAVSVPIGNLYLFVTLFDCLKITIKEFFDTVSVTAISCFMMTITIMLVNPLLQEYHWGLLAVITVKILLGVSAYLSCYVLLDKEDIKKVYLMLRRRNEVET